MSEKGKRTVLRDYYKGFIREFIRLAFGHSQKNTILKKRFAENYNRALKEAYVVWREKYSFRPIDELEKEGIYLIIVAVDDCLDDLREFLHYYYKKYSFCYDDDTDDYYGIDPEEVKERKPSGVLWGKENYYFIIDVEDGRNMPVRGKTVLMTENELEERQRFGLVDNEIGCLAMYNLYCFQQQAGTMEFPNLVATNLRHDFSYTGVNRLANDISGALLTVPVMKKEEDASVAVVSLMEDIDSVGSRVVVGESQIRRDELIIGSYFVPSYYRRVDLLKRTES
jgi:hypothetical protein